MLALKKYTFVSITNWKWLNGWMDGWKSCFKDWEQQSQRVLVGCIGGVIDVRM